MPLDDLKWASVKFDPDYLRLSLGGRPPDLPPRDEGGEPGGEPRDEGGKISLAECAVACGYVVFMALGAYTGSLEFAVTCLAQALTMGTTYGVLDYIDFDKAKSGNSTKDRLLRKLSVWDDFSAHKKTLVSSSLALGVSLITAVGFAHSGYRPIDDPTFGDAARKLTNIPCQIVDLYQITSLKNKLCRDTPAPR